MSISSRRLFALLIVTLTMVHLPYALADGGSEPRGSRATISTFETGLVNTTYTYNTDQVIRTSFFTLPNNAYVDQATLKVRPLPRNPGTKAYPDRPEVDVGDDGGIDWKFDSTGFGKFGYQTVLYNDSVYSSVDLKATVKDNSTAVRLPRNASVTTATLNVEGMFRLQQKFAIEGTSSLEYMGGDVSFVGDLNGDGWQDFAIGDQRNDSNGHTDNGRVLVFFGGVGLDSTPDLVMDGAADGDEFGFQVAPAGDVNNDGKDDLVVGAPAYDGPGGTNAGRVYIYFGGNPMDSTADLTMDGEATGDWFGSSATGVGDLNKDGYDDVVVNAANWRAPSTDIYGKIYVYLGGNPMNNVADLTKQGPQALFYWAKTVSPAGDINNDGYADYLIGTASSDAACSGCGRVDLFYGGAALDGTIDLTIFGTGGEGLGNSLASLGDINKDGYSDFVAGAMTNKDKGIATGAAYIYFGGAPPNNVADLKIYGPGGGGYFGSSVSSAGDINKDGWLDIAVGSEMNNSGKADTGAVFLFFGAATLDNSPDLKLQGGGDADNFGHTVSGGYDLDKDGYSDLLVGAYLNDSKAPDAGKAYLHLTVPKRAVDPLLEVEGLPPVQARIWNATGIFVGNKTVADFATALNTYLASAKATGVDNFGNEYVDVRLALKSTESAEMVISNVSIVYDYDAVIDVKPNGGSLQKTLDAMVPHRDTGTTKVIVWAHSMSAGKLFFHDLNIVVDEGPTCKKIPDKSIDEDTLAPHLLDFYDYFNDDNDPHDYLNYTIFSHTNGQFVNVSINQSHYLSVDALTGPQNDNWTGLVAVVLKATDTRNLPKLSNKFNITIASVDDPPVFLTKPGLNATIGKPYTYLAQAVDDDHAITYGLDQAPNGMTVNKTTGLVSWVSPTIGKFPVHLKVNDGKWDVYQNYTLDVEPPNNPPVVTSSPPATATVGIIYKYQFKATDKDGDKLNATFVQGPANMTMDSSWLVTYLPDISQVGDQSVIIQVTDGKAPIRQIFTLKVTSAGMNNVPKFTSMPPVTAKVGWAYTYNMTASDADRDKLTFSLDMAPKGMAVRGPNADRADWTPASDQMGLHNVVARVSDGKAYSLQSFTINVTTGTGNRPPVITSTPPTTGMVGYTFQYQIAAHDDDLDKITYSVDTQKTRIQIDPASGLLIWHPASTEIGNQTLTVRASDGKGFDAQTFVVLVAEGDKNGLPMFLSKPGTEGQVGMAYKYEPQAMDPDGDTITWSLAVKPDGMTVAPTTGVIVWTPAKGQEGNVTVELRASDGMGFSSQRFIISVIPGNVNQAFTVRITYPTNGTKVSKNMTVLGTATVAVGRLYEVKVKVDEGQWASATGLGTWNYTVNTESLSNGKHKLYVQAWDGATYSTPVSVDFTVENKGKPKPPNPNTFFGLSLPICLLGLVVLIVIIVAAVYLTRRPSLPPSARPPPRGERYPPRAQRPPPRERPEDRYDRDYYQEQGPGDNYGERYDEGQDPGQGQGQYEDQGQHDDQYGQDPGQGQYEGQSQHDDQYAQDPGQNDQGYGPGNDRR